MNAIFGLRNINKLRPQRWSQYVTVLYALISKVFLNDDIFN